MTNTEKSKKRNELIRKMAGMSREELAKMGDCDFNCPLHRPNGCGCKQCGKNGGYYEQGELDQLVADKIITAKKRDEIIEMLKSPNGCLGSNGCMNKDRISRSLACLKELCNPFRKIAGVKYDNA